MIRIAQDLWITGVNKRNEQFIVMYTSMTKADALRQLGRWAANPELIFTWYDAAVVSQKIRAEVGT